MSYACNTTAYSPLVEASNFLRISGYEEGSKREREGKGKEAARWGSLFL